MNNRIYLDNNATTSIDSLVLETLLNEYKAPPANPSSIHYFGRRAKAALVQARARISTFFGVKPEELVFTSGGTEGLNTLLRGFFGGRPKGHLITTAIEHSAIYRTVRSLEGAGLSVSMVPVDLWGAPRIDAIEEAIRSDTRAMIFSAANAETGVKLDLNGIASLAEQRGIPLFVDAVAFIGKEQFIMPSGVSAFAFSGHKFHAPKGVGGMVVRSSAKFVPLLSGGNQELNRRAGTENFEAILGLAKAIEILQERQSEIKNYLLLLRTRLEEGLMQAYPDIQVNGEGPRIANTSNLAFQGMDGETLLMHLDMAGIAVSHGSACSAGALEPSRVLLQMGIPLKRARSSLRFSLSRMNTISEIDATIERTGEIIQKLYAVR